MQPERRVFCIGLFLSVLFRGGFCATVEDANRYMDLLLRPGGTNGTSRLTSVDPSHLNDFQKDFTTKVLFVSTHGTVKYHSGVVKNLAQVERENCSAPVESKGKVRMNCTLVFPNLKVIFRGNLKTGSAAPTMDIKVKVNIPRMTAVVKFKDNPEKAYSRPKVDDLEVDENFVMNTEFRGLGPVNSKLDVLKSDFEEHLKKDLEDFIEHGLEPMFQCFVLSAGSLPKP